MEINEHKKKLMNETPPSSNIKTINRLTILFAFSWIVLLSLIQPVAWLTQDSFTLSGVTIPVWPAPFASVVQAILLLFPLAITAWLWRSHSARFRGWLETAALAALTPLIFLPLRLFIPTTHPDRAGLIVIFQLIGLGVYYLILQAYRKLRRLPVIAPRGSRWPAFLMAPLLLTGWLYAGALGGFGEIIVNMLVGLLYGRIIGWLIGHFLLDPLYQNSNGAGWDITLGSLGVGGVLAISAASFGFGGQTLIFLLLMPSIAWPLLGLLRLGGEPSSRNWNTAAWLIGLVMAGILILSDADEMTLLLMVDPNEVMMQLLRATAVTIIISRLIGLALWLARERTPQFSLGRPFKAATGLVWLAALALLGFKPNAGFHGDHLFVIMENQADVSAAADIADIDQRRQFVYEILTVYADESQKPLRQSLDRFHIGYQPYYLVNAIEVEGGPFIQLWLSRMNGVDRVLHDPELRPLAPFNADDSGEPTLSAPTSPEWNLTMIGADRVWEELGVRGAGVTLGQSDSGVQWDHPELLDSYRGRDGDHNYDWLDIWNGEPVPYDVGGHGTHTTATVVGNNVGVAPDAEWFACANLVRNLGSPGKYLACMQFMLAPTPINGDPFRDGDTTLAADVLNNSWGCPELEGCDPTSLETAVTALRAAGIFVVASAGNDGMGGCSTIADPISLYDDAFSVGAHDSSGMVADFSSRGPVTADGSNRIKPDILAPGVEILSAIPHNNYANFDGTSMAGPHIAGVVALIWSANPALIGHIDETERILIETAVPYPDIPYPSCSDSGAVPSNTTGYGLVNAYEAVKMALEK